jgi:hypothetical protein
MIDVLWLIGASAFGIATVIAYLAWRDRPRELPPISRQALNNLEERRES